MHAAASYELLEQMQSVKLQGLASLFQVALKKPEM
jgi:hypothetical protein